MKGVGLLCPTELKVIPHLQSHRVKANTSHFPEFFTLVTTFWRFSANFAIAFSVFSFPAPGLALAHRLAAAFLAISDRSKGEYFSERRADRACAAWFFGFVSIDGKGSNIGLT